MEIGIAIPGGIIKLLSCLVAELLSEISKSSGDPCPSLVYLLKKHGGSHLEKL
jgi:hypothetical protein